MSEDFNNNVVPPEPPTPRGIQRVTVMLKKVIEPVIVKLYRSETFAPTVVEIKAAAPTLIAAANKRRVKIRVFNVGAVQIFLGDSNVVVDAGECVFGRATWEEDRTTAAIYAITSAGTFNVVVTEL